jgi:ATP-dependent DNA helicase
MTEQAQRVLQKAEKKRIKIEENGSSSNNTTMTSKNGKNNKKQKMNNGNSKLQSVQEKDTTIRNAGTSRPIFIQPPNLASDCYLKDYQLEGVRWLASLFENGVSGILADGMFVLFGCIHMNNKHECI